MDKLSKLLRIGGTMTAQTRLTLFRYTARGTLISACALGMILLAENPSLADENYIGHDLECERIIDSVKVSHPVYGRPVYLREAIEYRNDHLNEDWTQIADWLEAEGQ